MTRLRKAMTVLLVALLACSTVFANGANETKEAPEDAKTTISVLHYLDMSSPNALNEEKEVWDVFKAEHPEIEIVREDLFNEPFHQKTAAYLATGKLPDVVYMWPGGRSGAIHEQHATKDLTPFLEKDGLLDDYSAAALAPQAAGYLAMLPMGTTSSHMMYVNTKVLRENGLEIPKTMDDLKAMVPVLEAKGIQVVAMDNMDTWVMQSCLFSLIAGRMGGMDWYDRLVAGEIDFEDDWFVNALNVVKDIYDSRIINPNSLASPYQNSVGPFALGQAAFYVDGDWGCGRFQEDVTTGTALLSREQQANDLELMVWPEIPGEVVHNTTSGVQACGYGISADLEAGSPEEAAAWELVKFMQSPYVQEFRLKTGASFPSNLNVDVDALIEKENLEPIIGKRAKFYANYLTTPVCDAVLDPETANVINVGLQEIGLGSKTPEQVAAEVNKAWNANK